MPKSNAFTEVDPRLINWAKWSSSFDPRIATKAVAERMGDVTRYRPKDRAGAYGVKRMGSGATDDADAWVVEQHMLRLQDRHPSIFRAMEGRYLFRRGDRQLADELTGRNEQLLDAWFQRGYRWLHRELPAIYAKSGNKESIA